jgi:hypothetical protein
MNYSQLCRHCITLMLPIALLALSEPSLAGRATITSTVLTSGASTAGAGFVETAAIQPDPNRAVFAAIESGTSVAAAPTASGNGLPWVQVASISFAGNERRLTVFRAMHASPTAGRIRFTFQQAQTSFAWSVIQLDGVDTTGTSASGATVQTVTNAVTEATTIAANLAPLRNENNLMLGFVGLNQNTSVTPDGDFIELTDSAIGSAALRLESQTAVNQTSCTPTFATAAAAIVAVEVQSGGVIDLATKWTRHTIVAGSLELNGSDGVDLADINGDGRVDVVSGHEQSNSVSVSLHPGFLSKRWSGWPTVVLPLTDAAPEDAVFADVDGDGHKDVIVGAEGGQRVVVLFAPANPSDLLTPSKWTRMDLGQNMMRVMRVAFANVAGNPCPEIVVGGKKAGNPCPEIVVGGKKSSPNKGATIGYYRLGKPSSPRTAGSWKYTSIRDVGWVMQMFVRDLDGDGDNDIVYTDREEMSNGDDCAMGLRWLENSGGDIPTWNDHQISRPPQDNHKWFDIGKWNGDNDIDIADCRSPNENSLWLNGGDWLKWKRVPILLQLSDVGECHHITFVNVDNAGAPDVAITHSNAGNGKSGVIWLHNTGTQAAPAWERGEISGHDAGDGVKFDNLIWYDIDGDGDLDAVTSEQNEPMDGGPGPGLGVIWYENPVNP